MVAVFEPSEYQARTSRAQELMGQHGLVAMLLTCEADVRYYTGYLTRFWESPSRPWFLVVPAIGKPVAVIPSIGAALMGQTWIDDIRTWAAPQPGDDGVSLLADTLRDLAPSGNIGLPYQLESHLRMPLGDYAALQAALPDHSFGTDHGITADLRQVKSEAEIAKIATACTIAGKAFADVPTIATIGTPLSDVFRNFQRLCLQHGADWVPYLAGGADQAGYCDVISPASDAPLQEGDVLMLDTGLIHDGYFCDYDRNFAVGRASAVVQQAQHQLMEACAAGLEAAQPGATAADVYHAMHAIVGGSDAGRLGHGLGMQLTEGLSLIAEDHTVLKAGMVITLEPSVATQNGRLIVHEENIVIREGGAQILSPWSKPELEVI
ncbi:M24 family metallopeptidase [Algirhabdus cladophorae]|uniref:M24 family metallopeptidase n=1 Tax=Algirhabdus cladophorae TaxID=3377108 RepID=UPI003B846ED2